MEDIERMAAICMKDLVEEDDDGDLEGDADLLVGRDSVSVSFSVSSLHLRADSLHLKVTPVQTHFISRSPQCLGLSTLLHRVSGIRPLSAITCAL